MIKNLSIIIPTLQKDIETLNSLVSTLLLDEIVREIIIIDNSLKGYEYKNEKVRVIVPPENLFVNPSWNFGVKEAKSEYVCLVNDDIKIPKNYCSAVLEQMNDECGIIGVSTQDVIDTRNSASEIIVDINSVKTEVVEKLTLKPITFRTHNFGIMMFFKKENYVEIPEDLKIYYGDDWIIYQAKKNGKTNAVACGMKIYHLGSLSSKQFMHLAHKEEKSFFKHIFKFKNFFGYFENISHRRFFLFGMIFSIRKNIKFHFKNAISVSHEYSKGIKRKLIYIFGIKISIRKKYKIKKHSIIEKLKFYKLNKNFIKLEKQLKNKDIINIVFMVSLASMFPAKPFLDYLLSKSSRYNVKILIIPDFRFGIENTHKLQEECYNELSQEYSKDIIIISPIEENLDNINISEICDILFCSLPYDISHKKYNLANLSKENVLLAMVNYGVYILPEFAKVSFSNKRLGYFKYLFYETPYIYNLYKKYSIVKGVNGILSGYCKMDKYKNHPHKKERKSIILAPHHSVSGGYNDILSLSNFYKYADFFSELPNIYPNIYWIFRPHPALFSLLEQDTFWGKEKVNNYINKMKQYPNVKYSHSGDYFDDFDNSDGIIQDCESFLFEYFYTGKPQCYMLKDNVNNKEKFGEYGSKLLDYCYTAYSEEDILNFINTVVLREQDVKKEARSDFAKNEVMINYPNVSEFIFNYFENIFGGNK